MGNQKGGKLVIITEEMRDKAIAWINTKETGDIFRFSELLTFLGVTGDSSDLTVQSIHRTVIAIALKSNSITCIERVGKRKESRYQFIAKLKLS